MDKREFVLKIKEGYSPDNENRELIANLNRALETISSDLNTKETHFILELIQNAEDNNYDSVNPEIVFHIENDKIVVRNNETGFDDKNVKSICSVGDSSKDKQYGYIGEKGIGFKSVFKITDSPKIFSNGYNFEFRKNESEYELGFIVPLWIDSIPGYVDENITNIVLPLKKGTEEIFNEVEEIDEVMLLFLKKLKKIVIDNRINGTVNTILKRKLNSHYEIENNGRTGKWKIIRKSIAIPGEIRTAEENRKNCVRSEIVFAFPLTDDMKADAVKNQKVFAFLPVREYGFKFIAQADFLLTANREDIHKHKEWNRWIAGRIPELFTASVEEFKSDEKLKLTYYNFIPSVNDVTDGLFTPAARAINDRLKETECILSESGNWRLPSGIFRMNNDFRNLFENDEIKTFFNREIISGKIRIKTEIMDQLEIPKFGIDELIRFLSDEKNIESKEDSWFAGLFDFLSRQNLSREDIERIQELKIVRLVNGKLACAAIPGKPVFFPIDRSKNFSFETEMNICRSGILDHENRGNVRNFLRKLGVKNADPAQVIDDHILPAYEDDNPETGWRSKSPEILTDYVRYIRDHYHAYVNGEVDDTSIMNTTITYGKENRTLLSREERLKKTIRLETGTGEYLPPDKLYLPSEYGLSKKLEELFEDIEEIHFVSAGYVSGETERLRELDSNKRNKKGTPDLEIKLDNIIKSWHDFLLFAGCEDKIRVVRVQKERREYTEGSGLNRNAPNYLHNNCKSPDLLKIFKKQDAAKNAIAAGIIDSNFDKYRNCFECNYSFYSRKEHFAGYVPTDFIKMLRTTRWLPSLNGRLYRPDELYIDNSSVREVYGDGIPFLAVKFDNTELTGILGIHSDLNFDGAVQFLKNLASLRVDRITNYKKIYEKISSKAVSDQEIIKLRNEFKDNALIFVKHGGERFYTTERVQWKNENPLFGSDRIYLEEQYPELEEFFVRKLGVSVKAEFDEYLRLLVDLVNCSQLTQENEYKLYLLYKVFNDSLSPEQPIENLSFLQSQLDRLKDAPVFLTTRNEFWGNDNDLFVNDDPVVYEIFKDADEIAFLKLPENHRAYRDFIEFFKIPCLSESVSRELVETGKPTAASDFEAGLRSIAPFAARYLYHNDPDFYNRLKSEGIIHQLISINCAALTDLRVRYALNGISAILEDKAFYSKDNNTLYICSDLYVVNDYDSAIMELTKNLGSPVGLDDFIINLLYKKTETRINKYLVEKRIGELPQDEISELFGNKNYNSINPEAEIVQDMKNDEYVEQEQQLNNDGIIHLSGETDGVPVKQEQFKTENTVGAEPVTHVNQKNIEAGTPGTGQNKQNVTGSSNNDHGIFPEGNMEETERKDWSPELSPSEIEISEDEVINRENIGKKSRAGEGTTSNRAGNIKDGLTSEAKKKIGRWGEQAVVKHLTAGLTKKYPHCRIEKQNGKILFMQEEHIIALIEDLNMNENNAVGHDIRLTENGTTKFIEVKTTRTDNPDWFGLSGEQWKWAREHGDNFIIFRVYKAGTGEPQYKEIVNPYKMWADGQIDAHPVKIKI